MPSSFLPTVDSLFQAPEWQAMPYKLLLLKFPDGSTLYLESEDVAKFGANYLANTGPGVAALMHLAEQVIPGIVARPPLLAELVMAMPFETIRDYAVHACWRSPAAQVATMIDDVKILLWSLPGMPLPPDPAAEFEQVVPKQPMEGGGAAEVVPRVSDIDSN